jgi:hypothetical protein
MAISTVTRVVGGKKITPKIPKVVYTPKAHLVRLFISQLNSSLPREARVLTKLNLRLKINNALIKRINLFTKTVISVLDSFPQSGRRIPAVFIRNVQNLKQANKKFIVGYRRIIYPVDTHSRRLRFVLDWLAEDIEHFATQIEMTHSSVSAEVDGSGKLKKPSYKNIPNRQRNPLIENVFLTAISQYQRGNSPKAFPPYKKLFPLMAKAGVTFSERSYRLLKKDYKQGNFGKLVR